MYKAYNRITKEKFQSENVREFVEYITTDDSLASYINYLFKSCFYEISKNEVEDFILEEISPLTQIDYGTMIRKAENQSHWEKFKEEYIKRDIRFIEEQLLNYKIAYYLDWSLTKIEKKKEIDFPL